MPYRLVSPDRKLYLVDNEHDLKAVGKLYGLTSPQIRNVRQLLGWTGVGNHSGDRNDRTERKEAENFQLLSQIHWLKRDDASELVPVVGKPPHIWKSVVTPHPDMKFAYKSLLNLLNGAKPSVSKEGFTWRLASSPAQIFTLGNGARLSIACSSARFWSHSHRHNHGIEPARAHFIWRYF